MSELSTTKLSTEEITEITKRIKKNNFFEFELNNIKILGKFGNLYTIDLVNGKSSSSGGTDCYYLKLLTNILRNDKTQWEWFIVSQFHKELRRGCTQRALSAGAWLAYIRNNSGVRQYVKSIILEETRSPFLITYIENEKDWRKCVREFCKCKKKWEISTFIEGRNFFYDECVNPQITLDLTEIDKTIEQVGKTHSYEKAYRMFAQLQIERVKGKTEEVKLILEEWFKSIIMKSENIHKATLLKYCSPKMDSWNNFESILNIEKSIIDINEETSIEQPTENVPFDFAFFPDYVADNHVFQGKRLFKKELDILKSQDHSKLTIDLRWSGITLGEYWRSAGFEKVGVNLCKTKWMDVIPDKKWKSVLQTESLTSGTF